MRKYWTWILPIAAIVLVTWFYLGKRHAAVAEKQGLVWMDCQPFQIHGGWGYDIVVKEKTYIHQDRIPAVSGDKPFSSREDALKVGRLMMDKLKAGKFPPAVTYREMKDIGIALN
jgi:hypothetical protein